MINDIDIYRNNYDSDAFGIRLADDIFSPLIYKRVKEKKINIYADIKNKDNVIIHFYKGNHRRCSYNQYVGNIILLLDKKITNKIKIGLNLKVEHNGSLSIKAYNTQGSEKCEIIIKNNLTSNLKKKLDVLKNVFITFLILFFILVMIYGSYFVFPHIKKITLNYLKDNYIVNDYTVIDKNEVKDKNIIDTYNKNNNNQEERNNSKKYTLKQKDTIKQETASAFEEEVYLKNEEGKIIEKIIYRKNNKNIKIMVKYYKYKYDKNNNLIKISEYNSNDVLLTYYEFEYDNNNNRTNVIHYDNSGKIIETE